MHCESSSSLEKNKVEKYIDNLSIVDSKYISTKELKMLFESDEEKLQKYLDELVDEGKLKRHFRFSCPQKCGNLIIIDDINSQIECDECEEEFKVMENYINLEDVYYSRVCLYNSGGRFNFDKYTSKKNRNNVVELEVLKAESKEETIEVNEERIKPKIFISHNEKDKKLVGKFVKLIEAMGIERNENNIFCSSYQYLGVPLGKDIPSMIKEEFDKNILVLSIITEHYNKSVPCTWEMAASWVRAKEVIPVVVPPSEFKDIKGFLTNSRGVQISNVEHLNELRKKIRQFFNVTKETEYWENDRNDFIEDIQDFISED